MKFSRFKRGFGLVLCLLLVFAFAGCKAKAPDKEDDINLAVSTTAPTETTGPKELSVTELLRTVTSLKDDLETALDDIKENNLDLAREKIELLPEKTEALRGSIAVTLTNLGDSTPSLQKELRNIQDVLNLVDQLTETILMPTIDMMESNAASTQETEGLLTKRLAEYLDFAETIIPDVENLVAAADGVDFSLVDSDGDVQEFLLAAEDLLEEYNENPKVLEAMKTILGSGEDRTYLVVAQNSAEIRASGGFPGAMGILRIQNGNLILEDFKGVNQMVSENTPAEANVTNTENRLFHYGLQIPRDADWCPDHERVAYVWALGYRAKHGEMVDGVITMTPVIVQRMLAAMDEEIKLFDGRVVNGKNAVRALLYDVYFDYFGAEYVENAKTVTDQLFADAAKKTMQKFMENLEIGDLTSYLSVAKESIEDRTLMLWMADEEEQAVIKQMGWHGGLNEDPQKPEVGIYYSLTDAGRMGWFLNMDTQMGEGTKNEDGSYTYPVTVTFSNIMTDYEKRIAQRYIIGRQGGAINGCTYFFAPAGGTVSDFVVSNGLYISMDNYQNLQLGYMIPFNIFTGQPITVTYNVTTAPGVATTPVFSKTPTIQEYR